MADKISDKKEQEIERLTRQLDHKEHELEENTAMWGNLLWISLKKRTRRSDTW